MSAKSDNDIVQRKSSSSIYALNGHVYESLDGVISQIDDEYELDVPDGWSLIRLKDLGTFGGGKTPSTSNISYWNGDINWITSKEVKTKYVIDTTRKLTSLGAKDLTIYPAGSLVFVVRSGILRRTFPVSILQRESTVNQDIKAFCPYSFVDPEYLYYAISAREEYILTNCGKDGTTVESIDDEKLRNLIIPIPSKEVQKFTCTIIRKMFELSDLHVNLIDYVNTIEKMSMASILYAAVKGQLVSHVGSVHEIVCKNPIIQRDGFYYEYKNDELQRLDLIDYELPSNWKLVRLEDVCPYIKRGKSPRYSEITDHPVIAQKCNQWDGIDLSKCLFIQPDYIKTYADEQFVKTGDVLINSTGLGTLGRIGIVSDFVQDAHAVVDSHVTIVRSGPCLNPYYLYWYLRGPIIQNIIEDLASGSTQQKELYAQTIGSIPIPLPPYEEQNIIVDKIMYIRSLLTSIKV